MNHPLVIIATYNEAENLRQLVEEVLSLMLQPHVLIIDDNSPDGTGIIANELAQKESRVHVIHRVERTGIKDAICDGFRWALEMNFPVVINMDGDLSHSPKEMETLINASGEADLVIGSRYLNGIRTSDWPTHRLFLSRVAANYVRSVVGLPLTDPTSGYRCFNAFAIKTLLGEHPKSKGFCFHIEAAYRVWKCGLNVVEVPIAFANRHAGKSKLKLPIIFEAIWIVFRLGSEKIAKSWICRIDPSHSRR